MERSFRYSPPPKTNERLWGLPNVLLNCPSSSSRSAAAAEAAAVAGRTSFFMAPDSKFLSPLDWKDPPPLHIVHGSTYEYFVRPRRTNWISEGERNLTSNRRGGRESLRMNCSGCRRRLLSCYSSSTQPNSDNRELTILHLSYPTVTSYPFNARTHVAPYRTLHVNSVSWKTSRLTESRLPEFDCTRKGRPEELPAFAALISH